MRLIALVIAVFFILPLAGQDLDKLKLTVTFEDTPLLEAITHLEKKFDLIFSFPREEVDGKTVNCSFQEADWETINQCLTNASSRPETLTPLHKKRPTSRCVLLPEPRSLTGNSA